MKIVVRHVAIAALLATWLSHASASELSDALKAVNAVGNGGRGHAQGMLAWRTLGSADVDSMPELLLAIDDAKPLAANWIRAAIDQVAERAVANGRELPVKQLEAIISDNDYSPRSQRLAYEWLVKVDDTAETRVVPKMLSSKSLEMRRDAVQLTLEQAEAATQDSGKVEIFRKALTAARDKDQIDTAFEALAKLKVEVDLPRHFGFIQSWRLIGPFDNTDKRGFDVAYPPEDKIELDKEYKGKTAPVAWVAHTTEDKYGMVDLNKALGKHMGAAGYAYHEFESDRSRDVDLRLGCICAAKVWLNGELRMAHEVYHSGTKIDQYVARGKLKKGRNTILLKVCQNEQTENWAQDWQFQFRVCDDLGTAVLAKGR